MIEEEIHTRRVRDDDGVSLVIVAISLVALVLVAALAIDGGQKGLRQPSPDAERQRRGRHGRNPCCFEAPIRGRHRRRNHLRRG